MPKEGGELKPREKARKPEMPQKAKGLIDDELAKLKKSLNLAKEEDSKGRWKEKIALLKSNPVAYLTERKKALEQSLRDVSSEALPPNIRESKQKLLAQEIERHQKAIDALEAAGKEGQTGREPAPEPETQQSAPEKEAAYTKLKLPEEVRNLIDTKLAGFKESLHRYQEGKNESMVKFVNSQIELLESDPITYFSKERDDSQRTRARFAKEVEEIQKVIDALNVTDKELPEVIKDLIEKKLIEYKRLVKHWTEKNDASMVEFTTTKMKLLDLDPTKYFTDKRDSTQSDRDTWTKSVEKWQRAIDALEAQKKAPAANEPAPVVPPPESKPAESAPPAEISATGSGLLSGFPSPETVQKMTEEAKARATKFSDGSWLFLGEINGVEIRDKSSLGGGWRHYENDELKLEVDADGSYRTYQNGKVVQSPKATERPALAPTEAQKEAPATPPAPEAKEVPVKNGVYEEYIYGKKAEVTYENGRIEAIYYPDTSIREYYLYTAERTFVFDQEMDRVLTEKAIERSKTEGTARVSVGIGGEQYELNFENGKISSKKVVALEKFREAIETAEWRLERNRARKEALLRELAELKADEGMYEPVSIGSLGMPGETLKDIDAKLENMDAEDDALRSQIYEKYHELEDAKILEFSKKRRIKKEIAELYKIQDQNRQERENLYDRRKEKE